MKKLIISLLAIFFGIFIFADFACAQNGSDTVELSVSVAARKPTDTINDFDFSAISTAHATGEVLGVSTERSDSQTRRYSRFMELGVALGLIFVFTLLINRHRLRMSRVITEENGASTKKIPTEN